MTKPVEYLTHANGARPFRVKVTSDQILVFDNARNRKLLTIENPIAFWPGIDPNSSVLGSSVLIRNLEDEYIYVGDAVYSFRTTDEIVGFYSPIGNSDVPYPVAYGKKNVYFMLDKKYIPRKNLTTPVTKAGSWEMYGEFYGSGAKKPRSFKMDVTMLYRLNPFTRFLDRL